MNKATKAHLTCVYTYMCVCVCVCVCVCKCVRERVEMGVSGIKTNSIKQKLSQDKILFCTCWLRETGAVETISFNSLREHTYKL